MKHEQAAYHAPGLADAGGQVAQLRHVLGLVEELARRRGVGAGGVTLDGAARISLAYAQALPIDHRRFEMLAADIARWAAAGLEALVQLEERGRPCRAAARCLADRLSRALAELETIIGA